MRPRRSLDSWTTPARGSGDPWDLRWAGHLYRRAAFAGSWAELRAAVAAGPAATVERLLAGGPGLAEFDALMDAVAPVGPGGRQPGFPTDPGGVDLEGWWLHRMVLTPHPLRERMTLFWHNHFATSIAKVRLPALMRDQNALFRRHALGKFGPLVQAVGKDPAMLVWLDSNSNVRGAPNENYARELMELFCLGVGNYTEADVREAARAFTGWHTTYNPEAGFGTTTPPAFAFRATAHDDGEKTVLGQTGKWDGADVARIVTGHPACARFVVRKLYRQFVSEAAVPPDGLIEPLAERFRKYGQDVGDVLGVMLRSRHFYSAFAHRQRVKGPVEYVVGLLRGLGAQLPAEGAAASLSVATQGLGQTLFAPPSVKGWDGGKAWLNTATVLARHNVAWRLLLGPAGPHAVRVNPAALADRYAAGRDVAAQVDFLLALLLQPAAGEVDDRARKLLTEFLDAARPPAPPATAGSARRPTRSPACRCSSWRDPPRTPDPETAVLTRRQLLARSLKASPLVALGTAAPVFVARTARAAEPNKDTVLVVLELTGGNDGLNTVAPYADDRYHTARPTLRLTAQQVVKVDDHVGLHPALRPLAGLLGQGQLAVVQGVGYPNPDRSHFESMDVWQSADPKRQIKTGWLGRGLGGMRFRDGAVPAAHVGTEQLPLAVAGAATGVPSIHHTRPYDLEQGILSANEAAAGRRFGRFGGETGPGSSTDPAHTARRDLIEALAALPPGPGGTGDLRQFVQRSQLQTYANIERLRKIMEEEARGGRAGFQPDFPGTGGELARNLGLVARMVDADFGTRVFYLSLGGFDTHSDQARQYEQLLGQLATAVAGFFDRLKQAGNAERVLLMTFSEFGRRVKENGSKGTDHGAASCLFVIGPGAKGGPVGAHPSLADLDAGDLKHHTDFRRVYATLLDGWLGCGSRAVLGARFDPLPLLRKG